MAKETRVRDIKSHEVDSTIELWACFGWDVISSNTVDTRRVQYVDGDVSEDMFGNVTQKINKVESGEKYVSVTFQRDKTMRNYSELVALEQKYYSLSPTLPTHAPAKPKKVPVLLIVLSVVGLIFFVVPGLVFILISVIVYSQYPKRLDAWKKATNVYSQNKAQYEADAKLKKDILVRARSLC